MKGCIPGHALSHAPVNAKKQELNPMDCMPTQQTETQLKAPNAQDDIHKRPLVYNHSIGSFAACAFISNLV